MVQKWNFFFSYRWHNDNFIIYYSFYWRQLKWFCRCCMWNTHRATRIINIDRCHQYRNPFLLIFFFLSIIEWNVVNLIQKKKNLINSQNMSSFLNSLMCPSVQKSTEKLFSHYLHAFVVEFIDYGKLWWSKNHLCFLC